MDNVDQDSPVEVKGVKAIGLAVGMSASAAFTESGDVYMWGYSIESAVPIKMTTLVIRVDNTLHLILHAMHHPRSPNMIQAETTTY
jgi:hypothetical protein